VAPSPGVFNTEPMAFDAATGTVVLFGGYANGGSKVLGDTWVWGGREKRWVERLPATSPSRRATTLAYDDATREVIIFGGQQEGGGLLADTWTWDGTTWTQRFPVSPPR
jgi:Galactose oxidase, central domain